MTKYVELKRAFDVEFVFESKLKGMSAKGFARKETYHFKNHQKLEVFYS